MLNQEQQDLLHILRNKGNRNPVEEELLKALFGLQMGAAPERTARYTAAKAAYDSI